MVNFYVSLPNKKSRLAPGLALIDQVYFEELSLYVLQKQCQNGNSVWDFFGFSSIVPPGNSVCRIVFYNTVCALRNHLIFHRHSTILHALRAIAELYLDQSGQGLNLGERFFGIAAGHCGEILYQSQDPCLVPVQFFPPFPEGFQGIDQ